MPLASFSRYWYTVLLAVYGSWQSLTLLFRRSSSIIYSPAGDQWGHPGSWRGVRIKLGSPQPAPLLVTPRCLILTLSWAKTTHARNWIHNQNISSGARTDVILSGSNPTSIISRDIYINKKEKAKSEWEFHKLLWFYQRLWGWLATGHSQRRGVNIWTQLFRIFPEQVDSLWWTQTKAVSSGCTESLASIRLSILWPVSTPRDSGMVTLATAGQRGNADLICPNFDKKENLTSRIIVTSLFLQF